MASGDSKERFSFSGDEIDRITEAMKDVRFRKLLQEYTEEIANPENLHRYEEELCLLEKERGVDAKFVYPEGGYVIKTTAGNDVPVQIVFINIAKNINVEQPSCSRSETNEKGLNWSVPYLLSPARQDTDENGKQCDVYDIIFHPDTLYMASKNVHFRKMIEETAMEGIEERFFITLNRDNISYPKMSFKGSVVPTIVRKYCTSSESSSPVEDMETFLSNKIKEQVDDEDEEKQIKSDAVAPKYTIKYQQSLCLDDYDVIALKSANLRPSAIIIDVHLPLLQSAKSLLLDISNQIMTLSSLKPKPLYELKVNLTFPVDEKIGSAQFDKNTRHLIVTLPVIPYKVAEDESVSVAHLPESLELQETTDHSCSFGSRVTADVTCRMPLFRLNQTDRSVVVIADVPNVDEHATNVEFCKCGFCFKVEFSSTAEEHYLLCIRFNEGCAVVSNGATFDVSAKNLVLRIAKSKPATFTTFYSSGGSDQNKWTEDEFVTDKTVLNKLEKIQKETETALELNRPLENDDIQVKAVSEEEVSVRVQVSKATEEFSPCTNEVSPEHEKPRNDSESSEETVFCLPNERPLKRGILKYAQNWRSISESSDDLSPPIVDFSPSDTEWLCDKSKKIVRFNDNISRNIFRPNSSILGQKRKNQKRSMQKKKLETRRRNSGSESEPCDSAEGCSSMSESDFGSEDSGASQTPEDDSDKVQSEDCAVGNVSQNENLDFRTSKLVGSGDSETADEASSKDAKNKFEKLDFRTRENGDDLDCDISSKCDKNVQRFPSKLEPTTTENEAGLDEKKIDQDNRSWDCDKNVQRLPSKLEPTTTENQAGLDEKKIDQDNLNRDCASDFRTWKKKPRKQRSKLTLSNESSACIPKTEIARKKKSDCKDDQGNGVEELCTGEEDENGWMQVKQKKRTKKSQKAAPHLHVEKENVPEEDEFSNAMFELD